MQVPDVATVDLNVMEAVETYEQVEHGGKAKEEFRNYEDAKEHVKVFYRSQHENQTYQFVADMKRKYEPLDKFEMGIWEALEYLQNVVDTSDPDTELSQLDHALQTAEAIRREYPDQDWFQLVGLIHDLGKILAVNDRNLNLEGEPQWCVVGDTFPVGCAFQRENIVLSHTFDLNADINDERYNTANGIYEEHCGFDNVMLAYGHDEYLYQVCVRNNSTLPAEGLAMIRYHSFYPWHRSGGYKNLENEHDQRMLPWVQNFNRFDLYSKADIQPNKEELMEYYKGIIAKYFPEKLRW